MVNYSRESSIIWIAIFAYNMYVTIVDNLLIPGLLKFYIIAIGINNYFKREAFHWYWVCTHLLVMHMVLIIVCVGFNQTV